jgi:hypothetical protein
MSDLPRWAVALVALMALGCGSVPDAIRGEWTASGSLGDGIHGWNEDYTIDADGYVMSGYPPIHEECDLEHLSSEGNVHVLRATGCEMEAPGMDTRERPGHEITVEVLDDGLLGNGEERLTPR